MDQVNEDSSSRVTVNLFDLAGLPAVPTAFTYRIDCMTTGTAVRGITSLTPASSILIPLTPVDNAIQNEGDPIEVKRVTVSAQYGGAGDMLNDEFNYEVRNLRFI
jgi:hypothetical protein